MAWRDEASGGSSSNDNPGGSYPHFNDDSGGAYPQYDGNSDETFPPFEDLDYDDVYQLFFKKRFMDLHTSFKDFEKAIVLFFNNDVKTAMEIVMPWNESSINHSLGSAIFETILAILSFDREQISKALQAIKMCLKVCSDYRKNPLLANILKNPYASYTDIEAHSELCYAEALLLEAIITIIEGEDLGSLLKATYKAKNCLASYQRCKRIFNAKLLWENEKSKNLFRCGLNLGLGTFNLIISHMPRKIVALLHLIGFSGDKDHGLAELQEGVMNKGLRSVLCEVVMLGYHLVICHYVGVDKNLRICENILMNNQRIYTNSVWFQLFNGRLQFLNGDFNKSLRLYKEIANNCDAWIQVKHAAYWDLMWLHCLRLEWRDGLNYINMLIEENPWSRTTYSYLKAAMLIQLGDDASRNEKLIIADLLKKADRYKRRISGKSLPMEKFILLRCKRFQLQNGFLLIPMLEMFALWKKYDILANNLALNILVLTETEKVMKSIKKRQLDIEGNFRSDNWALIHYVLGCCLRAQQLHQVAYNTFLEVLVEKDNIRQDTFLVPYAMAEMAFCEFDMGHYSEAKKLLQNISKYSGYSLESRLQLQVHSKLETLNKLIM